MFIGHFAVGFASKRFAPQASLGALMAAPMLLDLLWPIFMLTGWERVRIAPGITAFTPFDLEHMPYSHSLLMSAVWALLFASGYWLLTRYLTGAVVIALGVFSHWVLDFVTHRPDLQLYPGGTARFGLGLWNSIIGTLIVEGVMFMAGVWLYITTARPKDWIGVVTFWALIALMVLLYANGLLESPPTNERTLAWFALTAWIVPLWAWWIDRHHQVAA
jgi:membrane-bound metal-dependent hydrolase YbcI (DUF457 family)